MLKNLTRHDGATLIATSTRWRLRTIAFVCLLGAFACTGEDTGPITPVAQTSMAFAPRLHLAAAAASASAINRSRITMFGVNVLGEITDQVVAGPSITDLDPASTDWVLSFDYSAPSDFREVAILIELINVENGVETVQWSGKSEPFGVAAPAPNGAPVTVDVFRGSPADLDVTAIHITNVPPKFDEGDSATLKVVATGASNPSVFWRSSDTLVASVNAAGVVRGLRDGSVYITAMSGAARDSVRFTPAARAASIQIGGHGFSDVAKGEPVLATATVRDKRGNVVVEPVTWETSNASVLASAGAGLFSAIANGSASIRARSSSVPAVIGEQPVTVTSRVAANLHVSWVGLTPSDSAIIGNAVILNVVGASNGTADAPSVQSRLLVRDGITGATLLDSLFVQPAIPAGTPIVISAPFTFSASKTWPASAFIQIITDALNTLAETDETDNSAQSAIIRLVKPHSPAPPAGREGH